MPDPEPPSDRDPSINPLPPNWPTELDFSDAIRGLVATTHRQNVSQPIVGPDEAGQFPGALLRAEVPPVVPDANILRRDILRACRHNERTILVNAANSGMLRLFCAQHVIDEVEEHAEDWTRGTDVLLEPFHDRWERDYLPLLRQVDVQDGLLSQVEQSRIEMLKSSDADDVPTATLALHLGAFLLSTDKAALRAVYGPDVDFARHDQWVSILGVGSDAGSLGQMSHSTTGATLAVGYGGYLGLKWVWQHVSPFAVVAVAALAGFALYKMGPETRRKIADGGIGILMYFIELYALYQQAEAQFRAVAPAIPSWEQIAEDIQDNRSTLTRACLYTLARTATSALSVEQLAAALPELPVPRNVTALRAVLRSRTCFRQTYRGRWQVGNAACPSTNALT